MNIIHVVLMLEVYKYIANATKFPDLARCLCWADVHDICATGAMVQFSSVQFSSFLI